MSSLTTKQRIKCKKKGGYGDGELLHSKKLKGSASSYGAIRTAMKICVHRHFTCANQTPLRQARLL
jgi:hypothetical protein